MLAEALVDFRGRNPLVLAIPRGAVPMARLIADRLDGELDVVLVRKLGAPGQPELAIGSVDEDGEVYLTGAAGWLGIRPEYIALERDRQLALLRTRRTLYTPSRGPISPAGRPALVLDDGIATGSTMIAALRAVRRARPLELVAVTAVLPREALASIEPEADRVDFLDLPEPFGSVGEFFEDFSQVSDEEVIRMLSGPEGVDRRA
ncbi:MAG: phosphoribosyltransferase [Candidatus Eiseniibacteriota bacterium]